MLFIGILAITTTLTVAATSAVVPAKAATPVNYVALGDSYASGVGAGNYYSSSGSCDRSPNAYPALWAAANSPASFTFAACSGAKTSDVINGQLSSLSSSTTLVSLTIGGNDAGFSAIMETCVLESTSSCESAISSAEQSINATLPGALQTLLSDIHADAPNARVVVVGYPLFYDLSVSFCLGLSNGDHQAIDTGINDLDGLLATAAANDDAVFADARPAFAGHELCDGSGWLNSLTLPIGNSYHPTATGQKDGYLPTFAAAA
jgi:lysophospholipase L1-like esterase